MKTSLGQALLAVVLAASGASGLNADGWRSQSIYQVLTDRFARTDGSTTAGCNLGSYCGGTYRGLINKLDYIQGMGFTAVWISPIVKNIAGNTPYGDPYHGYWAQDIWSLNSNFGSEADLQDLSKALHDRGMYLMVDVVTNHMAYNGCRNCVNYGIYNSEFASKDRFHQPPCAVDFNSNTPQLLTCWSGDDKVSLPDLKTEDSYVRSVFNDWIKKTVAKYSIDGLRIDSARSVEKSFFPGFGQAAGVYMVGEVFDGNPTNLAAWTGSIDGVLNYAAYYWIRRAFASDTATVNELISEANSFRNQMDTSKLGTFIENHDNPRYPTVTSDSGRIKTAIAYTILSDGIPIIYQGQEQGFSGKEDPGNREALWPSGYNTASDNYNLIAKVNQIRNQAVYADRTGYLNYRATAFKINDWALGLRKGQAGAQVVGVFSNMGNTGTAYTVTLQGADTGFTSGQKVVEVMGCGVITADGAGSVAVQVTAGPRVLYPHARLVGSGICGL
ncbi:alpha-amylase [Microdochium trichocladiopsis]|uniref:Alpha-amylase n=1 Tax=Microdochium trichocladiopsis TaxID=1682393 RepID=A0A9P8YDC9_9PEZI|nr:alpha-amylase [Microdochium trichocladiopsis]KAH7039737.1 alpha-amylase [Microdochium trichocladiopsis]